MLWSLWKFLLIALVLRTSVVRGQTGGIPLDDLTLLRYTRKDIQFPVYSPEDRSEIVQQAQLLFSMYVHRDVKMAAYGQQVDPVPRLEDLAAKAPAMKDTAFHMEMSSIFSS